MLDKLLDFVISILKIFQFWVVIYPYESGVRLRLGKYKDELPCGFHWCLPFKIDRVIAVETVIRTLRLGAQSLVTKDGKPVVINAVVTCSISNAKVALLNVHSIEHVVDDSCSGLIAAHIASSTLEEVIMSCGNIDNELVAECKEQAENYGINIQRIQFTDVSPSRTIRLLNSTAEASSYWTSTLGKNDRL